MKLIGEPFWRASKGRWVQKYRDASGAERQLVVPADVAGKHTRACAEAARTWSAETIARRAITPENALPPPALAELAPLVLKLWAKDARLAPKTRADRESQVRLHVLPAFGSRELAALTVPEVRRWVRAMRERGDGATSIRNRLSTLRTLLADIRAEGLAEADPHVAEDDAVLRELPAKPTHAPTVLATTAFSALLACPAVAEVWRLRYAFAALAGLEDGVIAGLRVEDVDLQREVLCARRAVAMKGPKGHASESRTKNPHRGTEEQPRVVPLHPVLVALLKAWLAPAGGYEQWACRKPAQSAYLLPSDRGTAWRPKSAEHLRKDMVGAGVRAPKGFTLHRLRGCFLSWLAAHGVPLEQRKRLAGHAGDVQAEHYLGREALLEADRAAVAMIPVKLEGVYGVGDLPVLRGPVRVSAGDARSGGAGQGAGEAGPDRDGAHVRDRVHPRRGPVLLPQQGRACPRPDARPVTVPQTVPEPGAVAPCDAETTANCSAPETTRTSDQRFRNSSALGMGGAASAQHARDGAEIAPHVARPVPISNGSKGSSGLKSAAGGAEDGAAVDLTRVIRERLRTGLPKLLVAAANLLARRAA